MKRLFLLFYLLQILFVGEAQQKIILSYDVKSSTQNWWRDNNHVKFFFDDHQKNQLSKSSHSCLHVRWDSIPQNHPLCWFTDLKMDSLANPLMDKVRADFGDRIWISLWCNSGKGDTLWLQPLILTRGHKGKWGSKTMTPVSSEKWVFLKFKLSDLDYENWGTIPGLPDLKSDQIRCFEIGLRNGKTSPKGFIDARFDDLMISDYEPFPNK